MERACCSIRHSKHKGVSRRIRQSLPGTQLNKVGIVIHRAPRIGKAAQRSRLPASSFQSRLTLFLSFDHLRECLFHLAGKHDVFQVRRDELQSKF